MVKHEIVRLYTDANGSWAAAQVDYIVWRWAWPPCEWAMRVEIYHRKLDGEWRYVQGKPVSRIIRIQLDDYEHAQRAYRRQWLPPGDVL